MFANPFHRLMAVSVCLRNADQMMVAAVPLIAAAIFGLREDQIGAMVAAQGAAWLLFSLPAGVLVDRIAPLHGVNRALIIMVTGCAIAAGGLMGQSPVIFTFGAFLAAAAIVIAFLSEAGSVQRLVTGAELGKANARIQIIQSVAMLVGPALMGWLVSRGYPLWGISIALGLAAMGLAISFGFPAQDPAPRSERALLAEISEGFVFVRNQPLLRGIVACALLWNMAFLALAAIYVPFALRQLAMTADTIGVAQSAMGVGSIAAALSAAWAMSKLPPRVLLFFGPASSTVAAGILYASPQLGGFASSVVVFLMLGFGPIIWFVCQNTIRQLVTPPRLIGRVGAVIQLAIYGVRSIGALLGGWVAARFGSEAALLLIVALFALSTLTIPLSALGRLSAMPRSEARPA